MVDASLRRRLDLIIVLLVVLIGAVLESWAVLFLGVFGIVLVILLWMAGDTQETVTPPVED